MSLTLTRNENFNIEKMKLHKPESDENLLHQLSGSLKDFYTQTNGYMLQWSHKKVKDRFATGAVDILNLNKVLGDWKGVLWFEGAAKDDPMKNFRVLDYVTDEVFVGFYVNSEKQDHLFYYSISDVPVSLKLDMQGYIQIMCFCHGFKFWQKAILSILDKKEYPETEHFKKYMPQLFNDFKYTDFEALYQSIKLK